ncbi:MAG: succinate dehydrogenase, hydrophobic membrane anchor protein [Methylobacteriaceae bacterium]|nr:succinate dehydrogenase, hydrophobic membrane anchor protein [Methylobacteriaceae bacterium]
MSDKSTSLRSDASRVRHLGASRGSATRHALALRLTAAAMMPLTILFAFLVVSLIGRDYESVLRLFSGGIAPGLIALLFTLVGVYHMRKGMDTIIEDYAHGWWKTGLLVANVMFAGLIGAATALSIVKLVVGG